MSSAALTQFLIDVTRGHQKAAFAADSEAVLRASDLDDATRNAIRTQDIATLWRCGAHPMALLYFARACGWSGERYYDCIAAARDGRQPATPSPADSSGHP